MKKYLKNTKINCYRYYPIILMILIAAVLVSLTFPRQAYAGGFLDLFPNPEDFIQSMIVKNIIGPAVNAAWEVAMLPIKTLAHTNFLSGDFNAIFGEFNAGNIYLFLQKVNKTVVIPLGESILALALLIQFLKISQKIDANGTLPVVKEILILVMFYAISLYVVKNSFGLCESAFNSFGGLIDGVINTTGMSVDSEGLTVKIPQLVADWSHVGIGTAIMLFTLTGFIFLINVVAAIVSYIVCLARAMQLYIMATFAPLPFSFLTIDETRQWGVGFIKSFLSLCLAGAILVIIIYLYPYLLGSCIPAPVTGENWNLVAVHNSVIGTDALLVFIKMIAISLLFIIALTKSGSWAKDILGS